MYVTSVTPDALLIPINQAKIAGAQRRIYLSTLYFGAKEHELVLTKLFKVDTIRHALKANPDLKVSILTDALRGTREAPGPTCASLIAPLYNDFGPERVEICVFHTPNLTGVRKAILPKRINEGWGLQHMKLYGIDDEVIMGGANLSDVYFTNRQDRYHIIKSRQITDYFERIHQTVCSLSYRVLPSEAEQSGFTLEWPATNAQPAPLSDPKGYIATATRALAPLLVAQSGITMSEKTTDTQIYPLLQLTPLLRPDTSTELPALTNILGKLGTLPALAGSKWTFTAGYFNMTSEIRDLLLQSRPASATILAASPWANGFYGSKGVSGMLPAGYTHFARRFLDTVARAGLSQQIIVKEWRRGTVNTPGGWSYHAKGIWITLPDEQNPSISLVGSSNYTQRSYNLDLEANTMIVTQNPDLQRRLGEEEKWLQEYATTMDRDDYAKTERRVGLHVRIALWIVTLVGGAL
ncbi:CDP-diacylglycerol--glycerol-3-phosphate 3-phosphatidyltransferase [Vermiconidia calcicola]|uniref:CDP-diacylglycerol--glycerol-3-phosphate 3-phosphatidyltransferase n=1 Tax=Vermiconidia calcicola TaxID=1690605 RepID=A0ACC3MER5_9PEZI|nr:CDP-diacylglycerol--glycerol-3-phosphate 3-phosphatidyltransferase [Vermiconidia calcicola]